MHFLILPFVFVGLAAKIKNKRHFKATLSPNKTHLELSSSNHSNTKCLGETSNNEVIEVKPRKKASSAI